MPKSNINIYRTDDMIEGDENADIILFTVDQKHKIHNNNVKQFNQHYEILTPIKHNNLSYTGVNCCLLKSFNENTHRTNKIGIYGLTRSDGVFSISQLKSISNLLTGKSYTLPTKQLLQYLTTAEYPTERETTIFYPYFNTTYQTFRIEFNLRSVLSTWVGDVILLKGEA